MITSKTSPRTRRSLPGVALCALLLTVSAGTCAQTDELEPDRPLTTELPAAAVEQGVLGEPQLIEADVGTDETLVRIALFHRFDGETRFRETPMEAAGVDGVYSASVPTAGVSAERLEFYIVAEDELGGTLVKGSADDPLTRTLVPPPGAVTSRTEDAGESDGGLFAGDNRRYLYYALGALAVGALAVAASGGGGGGDSDEGCGPEGCRLTVTLPPPE